MGVRVTSTDVKDIIDTTLTGMEVDPFIKVANALIEKTLTNESIGEPLLIEIERWLAAHFLAIARDPREREAWVGDDVRVRFEGRDGIDLGATRYGQQAKILDISGKLSQLGKAKALFKVITEEEFD